MTFQFIVEYIDPREMNLPFDFNYSSEDYADLYVEKLIHNKRVRAKNSGQAIQRFIAKYPEYEIIGWR